MLEKTLDLSSTNSILFSIPSTIYWIFFPIISISTIPYGIDYTSDAPLTPPTDQYTLPFVFQTVFESPEAKAAILRLHRSLPESMNNIVDNLQTKEDLTYDHIYNKLMDLKIPTAVNSADNKAYKTADVKGKGKELGREPSRKGPTAVPKECSYCKKHYPTARSDGHTWNECVKLKAANLKNKEKRTINMAKIGKEETPEPVSTLSSVRTTTKISSYPRWVIDTGAS